MVGRVVLEGMLAIEVEKAPGTPRTEGSRQKNMEALSTYEALSGRELL